MSSRSAASLRPVGANLLVVALLGALFLQATLSMRLLNASFDEPIHLVAGYTYWQTGQIRLNPEHPPLIKLLAAWPLRLLEPRLNLDNPAWKDKPADQWELGDHFLYSNDADRLLFWGRMPTVLLALLLGLYVYRWARDLYGTTSGIMALFLYVFCPNVIAHSRFITMDIGLSCFFLISLYYLWRFVTHGRKGNLVAAGVALGLALAAKFSAVILVPSMALLMGMAALRPPTEGRSREGGRRSERRSAAVNLWNLSGAGDPRTRLTLAAVAFLLLLGIAFLVVYAVYLFPRDLGFYLRGLMEVGKQHDPNYEYYLLGDFSDEGWWYYFLVAFVIKTPLPTLIVLAVSLVLLKVYPARRWLDEAFLVIPGLLLFVVTSALAMPLGVRYLLPVYPLLFVFAARSAPFFLVRRVHAAVAAGLGLWLVAGAIRIYPDHLAYFNEVVGGPGHGHNYLDDSNIDWGTDLKRLKSYMEKRGIEHVRLLYDGRGSPDYYKLAVTRATQQEWAHQPLPGLYAASTHMLIHGKLFAKRRGWRSDWLSRYQPIDRVGYGFYIFRFDDPTRMSPRS
jgi:hypothetical protein